MRALVAVLSLISVGYTLNCYKCSNLADPDYCTNSEVCGDKLDMCYKIEGKKSDGQVFYNLGCAMADISGCTCEQGQACSGKKTCCREDNCNSKGLSEDEEETKSDNQNYETNNENNQTGPEEEENDVEEVEELDKNAVEGASTDEEDDNSAVRLLPLLSILTAFFLML